MTPYHNPKRGGEWPEMATRIPALDILGIETLEQRRVKLCQSFAEKTLKSRHLDIFKTNPNLHLVDQNLNSL